MEKKIPEKQLTFIEHLSELRQRLIKSVISVIIGASLSYFVIKKLLELFIKPVGNLVFIAPQEAFIAYIKLSIIAGIFIALPFILYQIWSFAATGLNKKEKKYIILYAPFSFLFFIAGSSFAYFLILPLGIKFLLGFATENLQPMISLKNYISFAGMLLLAFGVVFEMPLIIMFLTNIGIVDTRILREKRKVVIVSIFVVSAILTPPDVITQILMAGPLILLYEISILLAKITSKKQRSITDT